MNDTLTLEFTREEAFQLLTLIMRLNTVAELRAPELMTIPHELADAKVAELVAFVEGR